MIITAQEKFTISGYVSDDKSGERLIGATVFVTATGAGTISNNFGFFSLTLPGGMTFLEISFVGYKTSRNIIELDSDAFIDIRLERGIELKEISVKAPGVLENNPELSRLSRPEVSMQMIETTPVILGERDVLKTLQFLPGIKQGNENTASYNVRGGSADQNLILLDGVPVYNVNHMLGFFSVFNDDAIKNVNLIKGGIPARYGGRLSSVLDISMKEGNLKESSGVFSISAVSGRFTWEAPVIKDTAAYIISFRRTFFDLPLRALQTGSGSHRSYGYYFYDFNGKTNWIINPGNRLFLSLYTGSDKQFSDTHEDKDTKTSYRYNWGNFTSVLRWNRIFSPKLFSNFSAYYSRFHHLQLGKAVETYSNVLFKTTSELQDISVKGDFEYFVSPKYTLRFGSKFSYLIFNPNIIQVRSIDSDVTFNEEFRNTANESNIYLENAFSFSIFRMNMGSCLSGYFIGGTHYLNFQPRVSASVQIDPQLSVNISYTKLSQHLHLLTNSSLGMPTDLWVASTSKIAPQEARQVSLGVSRQYRHDLFFGLEGYYKWMEKVIHFDEGVAFLNPRASSWEENVLSGMGRAYGAEFMAQKESGPVTGIFSYTLSWSERKYSGLNNGRWFPFKYDRRHDISILAEYQFAEKYQVKRSFTVGFTLQSGNNLSIPDVQVEGLLFPGRDFASHTEPWETVRYTYNHPNNFKMPAFHHLDIGYNITKKKSDSKSAAWTFSVYNVYNRMNPWYYYKSGASVKQVSLFPLIPSLGYKYSF